ncbi:MAG: hypothetical protein PHV03_10775 [Desulfitobacteriaceae bacterium]|jgi:hypothetical protein|nr:hypothetical protein [Desulfitobacteriaceae bacterium]MDD3315057.1 hypothetical protein [Syntrophaceticus sp.]
MDTPGGGRAANRPGDTDEAESGRGGGVRTNPTSGSEGVKGTTARGLEETGVSIEQIEEQAQVEDEEPGAVYAEYKPQTTSGNHLLIMRSLTWQGF